MSRRITVLVAIFMSLMLGCAACASTEKSAQPSAERAQTELNPMPDAANKDQITATLYYGCSYADMLVGEARDISVPVNERVETAVLEALIAGPSLQSGDFKTLISENTEVVSVTESGSVLLVTLTDDFLQSAGTVTARGLTDEQSAHMRLAVYSIVNTMVELSGYSRVQLLIDNDGSGSGSRMSAVAAGIADSGVLEPLEHNMELLLTPQNTLANIFDAMGRVDYAGVYNYVAYNDKNATQKPDLDTFITRMNELKPTVEGYTITGTVVSQDGQEAIGFIDYSIRKTNGESQTLSSIPATLIRENDVWKMRYSLLESLFTVE